LDVCVQELQLGVLNSVQEIKGFRVLVAHRVKFSKMNDINQWRSPILTWLADNVPAPRLKHILRVEAMAIALAECHGLSTDLAAKAGLMHDLAKYFAPERLLAIAASSGIEIDPVCQRNPHLLHADVSAVVAETEFQVQNPDILQAIRDHTLGNPGMPQLSCVVYLADSLEPGRGDNPSLQQLRQLSQENLNHAVWLTAEASLQHLLGSRHLIHPRTILTRNWFMEQTQAQ
jgi:predicted HD superfamily hydrolase involved in NAD metabolism